MKVLQIIDTIARDSKRTEKEKILLEHRNNSDLKKVFFTAYNPDYVFWIAKHPAVTSYTGELHLSKAIDMVVEELCSRKVTGNAAIALYSNILSSLDEEDSEVLRRIINRDLRCGVGVPTINKVWKDLVPVYEMMLAETDPKKLSFPDVITQIKSDGIRCLLTLTKTGDTVLRTRNGNSIDSLSSVFSEDAKNCMNPEETWDGELVCYENGVPLSRKISNGLLNKAIRGTISEDESKKVRFIVWDIVDRSQKVPYWKRLETLTEQARTSELFIVVVSRKAETLEEVHSHFRDAIENGDEGVIAKNLNSVWQPKRSFDLVKFKDELTCDLIVVDIEKGTGRNEGRLGALVCESQEGLLRVNVGTGFNDHQRDSFDESMIGKIVEVKYNAQITKKDGGMSCLYLPRFLRIRLDKSIANVLGEIK